MPGLTFELLQQEIDYVVLNDDIQGAFECYNLVKGWLEKSGLAKKNSPEYTQYYNYLMKLKFLSLNYFDNIEDYYDLLKNYFSLSQEISYFDLWSKLEVQLVYIRDINKRDAFKGKLKEALEKSDDLLISRQKYSNDSAMPRKVSEWIKDFIVNLGLDNFDKLKKAEYIANGKHIKALSEEDKNKVINLLDIYEKLKLSSKTPAGYENSVSMNIDGRQIIFSHGEIEEVSKEALKQVQNTWSRMKTSESDDSGMVATTELEISTTTSVPVSDLDELQQALQNYPAGTLEHKAISQEISRLKVLELKAAQQKSNVKK